MPTTTENPNKLIHIARIVGDNGQKRYLFLRKVESNRFTWFEERQPGEEFQTEVSGLQIEEALRLAPRHWKNHFYTTLMCGFRYTLPERDEHGINALFHQMAASYSSMNGIYYDDELGNNCFVQNASNEALDLWQLLKKQKRL
jgi:hypothetical protein